MATVINQCLMGRRETAAWLRLWMAHFFNTPSFRASPAFSAPPAAVPPTMEDVAMDEEPSQPMGNVGVSYDHRGVPSVPVTGAMQRLAMTAPASACECDLSAYDYDATGYSAGERWPSLGSLYDDTSFPELNCWAAMAEEQRLQMRKPFSVQQDNAPPRTLGKRPSHEAGLQMQDQSKHSRGELERRW